MTLKIECADDKNKLAFKTNYLYLYLYISYILFITYLLSYLFLISYYIYYFTYEPIFVVSTFANKLQIEKHAD